jgi:hypothetical protein
MTQNFKLLVFSRGIQRSHAQPACCLLHSPSGTLLQPTSLPLRSASCTLERVMAPENGGPEVAGLIVSKIIVKMLAIAQRGRSAGRADTLSPDDGGGRRYYRRRQPSAAAGRLWRGAGDRVAVIAASPARWMDRAHPCNATYSERCAFTAATQPAPVPTHMARATHAQLVHSRHTHCPRTAPSMPAQTMVPTIA